MCVVAFSRPVPERRAARAPALRVRPPPRHGHVPRLRLLEPDGHLDVPRPQDGHAELRHAARVQDRHVQRRRVRLLSQGET